MRRLALMGLLLVGCTPSSPERGQPEKAAQAPEPKVDEPKAADPIPPPVDTCAKQVSDYLAARAQLSRCETDSDCAEMWPGLCPHGPYYIHRDADIDPILELERVIMDSCSIPECEPPMELGIAHCEAGQCAKGRAAPVGTGMESCWDYRETWLEAHGSAFGTTSKNLQGITPHVAISPASPGVLVLEVDWPAGCADCNLMISEHNSGMARLLSPKSSRTQAERNGQPVLRERLEFPVTPGPYHMVARAGVDGPYVIKADLRDANGERGRVSRHGVGWQRMCEG